MFSLKSSIITASYVSWIRLCCTILGFLAIYLRVFVAVFNVLIVIFSSINNYFMCWIFIKDGVIYKKQNKAKKLKKAAFPK